MRAVVEKDLEDDDMLTVIKKDNTTEEFIDEKIVDAVKKAAFRCDTLIDDASFFFCSSFRLFPRLK